MRLSRLSLGHCSAPRRPYSADALCTLREQLGDHNDVRRPVTIHIQLRSKSRISVKAVAVDAVCGWAQRLKHVFDQLHSDGAFRDFRRARILVD